MKTVRKVMAILDSFDGQNRLQGVTQIANAAGLSKKHYTFDIKYAERRWIHYL